MDKYEYVVRGANIFCDCGSHLRKLNLPNSHGAYVNGKPMMNESDSIPEVNISNFGICSSPENQSGETVYLISMDGQEIQGKPCLLALLAGSKWEKTKEQAKVEGKSALTTESELHCSLGGVIRFNSSGQHEEE
ncbi:DUF4280 domain-containing protein [Paenibacillus woosongensis]|uniref:DUF4280 domain-containing protein n=1 Tax=Paenibacillus woosongensis TaxID=307580 RepID=A0AA95I5W2_9BACL|nr:DUF4280 domain-containing protein [Paenibacillus woosongensis]WHX48244.1 DUF4280 domain-containing protein [Paenibacillus woosongensis]